MASPVRGGGPTTPPNWLKVYRCIAVLMLVFIGVAVLVTWLMVKPRRPLFIVIDGSVHDLEVKDNHLNATFDFFMKAYNPSRGASVYYDSMEVSVLYDQGAIAFGVVEPFFQPHNHVTQFEVKPMAQSAPVSKDLRMEESSGEVEFSIRVMGRIHFKLGSLKLKESSFRASCSPVVVPTSSSKKFHSSYCHTHL